MPASKFPPSNGLPRIDNPDEATQLQAYAASDSVRGPVDEFVKKLTAAFEESLRSLS